ncbi:ATP-binding protein [Rhodococcus sp. p52]|uniref:AAA family ATPase n=1 Tax=Rhodococcus sp. p52 TaxID=935199 RepID=UPI0008269992|nr:AAA family ATPase [Rhodococcus sp. p52]AOD23251.1 ATP-binding protein [Rhodococcus sp. p52]
MSPTDSGRFIVTKEHRRFTEFADAVRRDRTIGLCFGPAGVGKTLSARRYAHWDTVEPLLDDWGPRDNDAEQPINAALARARTIVYTPYVGVTPRRLREDLHQLLTRAEICIDTHLNPPPRPLTHPRPRSRRASRVELCIVDEAERLSTSALEHLRDHYDRGEHGLIFIGMPGIEKRFVRYPQLYSRVGFAHHYRPLSHDELIFVLTHHWRSLAEGLDPADFTDHQAIAAVARLTGGNFRLIQRLFRQVDRILEINDLTVITADVIDTAAETLVIGTT